MSTDLPKDQQVAKTCIAMHMMKTKISDVAYAIDDLQTIIAELKALPADQAFPRAYMQPLFTGNYSAALYQDLKQELKSDSVRWQLNKLIEFADNLNILKFSEEENFHFLLTEDMNELNRFVLIADAIRNVLVIVSRFMSKDKFNLEAAIKKTFSLPNGPHLRLSKADIAKYLSNEYKIGLYQHVRLNMIMGLEYYHGPHVVGIDYTRVLAQFHIDHPDAAFFAADCALDKIHVSAEKTLALLHQYGNGTLTSLITKAQAMPAALEQMTLLMQRPFNFTFELAKNATFNATTTLQDSDFMELLTPPALAGLQQIEESIKNPPSVPTAVVKPQAAAPALPITPVLDVTPLAAMPSFNAGQGLLGQAPAYALSTPNMLTALSVGGCCLFLLAYRYQPRVITRPLNFFKSTALKFCGIGARHDEENAANDSLPLPGAYPNGQMKHDVRRRG